MKKKGIWVDSSLFGLGLSPLDKLLYSQIDYLSKDNGFCVKSDREFSTELEVSERSITSSIAILVEKGILTKETDRAKGNYRRLYPSAKSADGLPQNLRNPSAKSADGLPQNLRNPSAKSADYIRETTIKQLNKQSISNSNVDFQKENHATTEIEEVVFYENINGCIEDEKKAPQTGGAGGRKKKDLTPEVEFSESELSDFITFEKYVLENYEGANVGYYYTQISKWENQDGSKPKRKNWKLVIKTFIMGDYQKGKMVTVNHKGYDKQDNSNIFAKPATNEGLDDIINLYFESKQ